MGRDWGRLQELQITRFVRCSITTETEAVKSVKYSCNKLSFLSFLQTEVHGLHSVDLFFYFESQFLLIRSVYLLCYAEERLPKMDMEREFEMNGTMMMNPTNGSGKLEKDKGVEVYLPPG